MIKYLSISAIYLSILIGLTVDAIAQGSPITICKNASQLSAARCTGSASCSACSNCSRCAHCNSGGSCGVCSSSLRSTSIRKSLPADDRRTNTHRDSQGVTPKTKDIVTNDIIPKEGIVTAATLNLRSGPGTSFEVIDKLQADDIVVVVGTYQDWLKVSCTTGATGYVLNKYVRVEEKD